MRFPHTFSLLICTGLTIANPTMTPALELRRQTLRVPATSGAWRGWQMTCLADVNNDGLADLLAVGPVENKLWVYRQRASGFPLSPDQAIELPIQTTWLALCDVEAQPGPEMVLSTAAGLAYLRQKDGVFESQPHPMVQTNQVFTNHTAPKILSPYSQANRASSVLPVVSASRVLLYQRNADGGWSFGAPLPLQERRTQWSVELAGWSIASARSRSLTIRRSFLVAPNETPEQQAEAEAVEKILIEKERPEKVSGLDLNGDGRRDLVLWRLTEDLEPKTDILVFLRGTDNRLPERPTQVLHCHGFPVHNGHPPQTVPAERQISPVCALAGDGRCALVLVALKTTITSVSGLADMVMSGSLGWKLTIRTFSRGSFSVSPDASVSLTTMVPTELAMSELFLIDGDFNGDGRPDLLLKRSPTQWDLVLSSARRWFANKPACSFDIPLEGNFVIQDLNSDGLSDLVVQAWDEPTLFIFVSASQKGTWRDENDGGK